MPGLDREFKASLACIAKMYLKIKKKGRGRREGRRGGGKKSQTQGPKCFICTGPISIPHKGALYTSIARYTQLLHSETTLFRWIEDQDGDKKGPLLSLVTPSPGCVSHPPFCGRHRLRGGMHIRALVCLASCLFPAQNNDLL